MPLVKAPWKVMYENWFVLWVPAAVHGVRLQTFLFLSIFMHGQVQSAVMCVWRDGYPRHLRMAPHGYLEWDIPHIRLTISSAVCIGCHGTETPSGVLDSGGSSKDTSGHSTGLVNSHYHVWWLCGITLLKRVQLHAHYMRTPDNYLWMGRCAVCKYLFPDSTCPSCPSHPFT